MFHLLHKGGLEHFLKLPKWLSIFVRGSYIMDAIPADVPEESWFSIPRIYRSSLSARISGQIISTIGPALARVAVREAHCYHFDR